MSKKVLQPQFFFIGGQRCGSTWAEELLLAHPAVFIPAVRREFDYTESDREEYDGQPVFGLFNAELLSRPDAAQSIAVVNAEARLIAFLRNPVDRAFSWYLTRLRYLEGSYADRPSFESALECDASLIEGGRYADHLARFFDIFPREQMMLALFDDLETDPRELAERLLEFVGIGQQSVPEGVLRRVNYSARNRSDAIHGLLRGAKRASRAVLGNRLTRRLERSALVRRLRMLNETVPSVMEPRTRHRLLGEFREANERLAAILGRDLSDWND